METREPNQVITCPHCGKEIRLTEVILRPFRQKWQKDVEAEYTQKLDAEREKTKKEAEESAALQFKERQKELDEREIQVRRESRELQEQREAFERELERKIDERTDKIRERHRLELSEKDEQNKNLRKQIEALKAEQVSPAIKGGAGEHELENILKSQFPGDEIQPIRKGQRGADIIQKVNNEAGQFCGTILWESKNTKKWSDRWINKLKDDQRHEKAEIAVLATLALPKDVKEFDMIDHIWITRLLLAPHLASVLRMNLVELAMKSIALVDKGEQNGKTL